MLLKQPILFGGTAQKLYKITASKGDIICNREIEAKCVWHVFHHQWSSLINERKKVWDSIFFNTSLNQSEVNCFLQIQPN